MKKTAIIYSYRSVKTRQQVQKIIHQFGDDPIEQLDADSVTGDAIMPYTNLILAVPTWFDGELPNYWDELLPDLEERNFKGKKVAIFGGGNQRDYPENFVDGIGIMAQFMEQRGAKLVGFTSTEGYSFESSRAVRGNEFMGLAIDVENQSALTDSRIEKWVLSLKIAFDSKK
ncbi:flavodoxin I [Breznakibacter xylanolyticus]|uniref:Flavodoxin n=1 Tax=Breznakibacter xylanolyticus TaxID=990 RepID=A0A2W7N5K9_9BACT|nr:flavodoxin [Breznakibacter xylanolyticus]MBN2742989.1 flavodoxin [Marinilabiliaceae bacterium]PZX15338.1 flavodoxin I [Breznakibacter xylanolyticus]